jgi:hypothetical protein
MAYTRGPLSGSTHGRGIKVTGTTSGGAITVHTGQASTTLDDIVTIYAHNADSTDRLLTLEWGGATDPDDLIEMVIPRAGVGLVPVVIDLPIRNSLVVEAWAAAANVIVLFGFVNVES